MYSDEYTDGAEFSFPRALTVSEISEFIKRLFDGVPQFSSLSVQGEISNFKNHFGTGHFYFTLKDENASIKAVMFRSYASAVKFNPENGMKVTVHGRISTYPRDGQYQIYCDRMEPLGIGALFAAYEQLKKKLFSEGLFDEAHKKPLPKFPSKVGVVTSETGAAVRDIINISSRRWPLAELILYPALVQGDGAAPSVIKGIEFFNKNNAADVIIIGRGGGSIEDLWAFNDESLARAIYASDIPIVSAVGHETDFTISDFVADVRAPTPSAAAEIVLPDFSEVRRTLLSLDSRQKSGIISLLSSNGLTLRRLAERRVLTDPMAFIEDRVTQLNVISEKLTRLTDTKLTDMKNKLTKSSAMLNTLSPLAVLSRGYGAVSTEDGAIVKSVSDVKEHDVVNVKLRDGYFKSSVNEVVKG